MPTNIKILTHGDTDGVCSGALVSARYPKAEVWFTHPAGLLNDLKDLDAGITIICDVAISEKDRDEIFSKFQHISSRGELIYIDHHPLPLNTVSGDLPCTKVIRNKTKSTSELTYRLFQSYIDKDLKRVALFGAISDYCDETKFVHEELEIYDKRTIYLESGLLSQCLGEAKRDHNFKRKLVRKLARRVMPSTIDKVVKMAINATKKEWRVYNKFHEKVEIIEDIAIVRDLPEGVSTTKVAKFAMGATERKVGMGIKFRKDFADMGLRKREDFPLDLNHTLRTIAPRFGGTGGGHPSAAGARIPRDSLDDFLSALAKEISAIL